MNVCLIGIRGHGVIYSGYETFTEFLIKGSSNRFHYSLFCRKHYQKDISPGKNYNIIVIKTPLGKYLETVVYSLISTILSIFKKIDVVLYLGISNTFFIFLQKFKRRLVIVNVDGLDWRRKRWNVFGKLFLRLCEINAIIFADIIITDSQEVDEYYKKKYPKKYIKFISYGADVTVRKPGEILKKFDLKQGQYIHWVGRFVPENAVEDVINAFKKIQTNKKCVIVGDENYESVYKKKLLQLAREDKRIIFTGFLRRNEYEEISSNSLLYVESKEVGGIHPSLIEAMAFGRPIIAKRQPPHVQVLGSNSEYYSTPQELQDKLNVLLINSHKRNELAAKNKLNAKLNYQWKNIILQYEKLFDYHT